MKKTALVALVSAVLYLLLGLATIVGQITPADILAFVANERPIYCGAEVKLFNIVLLDLEHNLLCNLTGIDGHAVFAGWSPDGTRVAVEAGGTIYIADSQTREVARLAQAHTPSWSVNGTLVFQTRVGNIVTTDQNGENRRFLTSNGRIGRSPRWSSDGTRVIFYCDPTICVVDSDGENLRQIDLSNDNIELAFDNGEMLVIHFTSMYIVDRNGEVMRRVLRDYMIISEPWFSIDGRQAAFYTSEENGNWGVRVTNTKNAAEQLLFSGPSHNIPGRMAWSPDGNRLAFDFDSIYLADIAAGSVRLICANCISPVWVPHLALYAMIAKSSPPLATP